MAYASEHLSLAALELFVHVEEDDEPGDLVAVEADVAVDLKTATTQQAEIVKRLGQNWRFNLAATRAIGDEWFSARDSLLMLAPSVVIDIEWNVLINPLHADFAGMKIVQQRVFRFDERMFKR